MDRTEVILWGLAAAATIAALNNWRLRADRGFIGLVHYSCQCPPSVGLASTR